MWARRVPIASDSHHLARQLTFVEGHGKSEMVTVTIPDNTDKHPRR